MSYFTQPLGDGTISTTQIGQGIQQGGAAASGSGVSITGTIFDPTAWASGAPAGTNPNLPPGYMPPPTSASSLATQLMNLATSGPGIVVIALGAVVLFTGKKRRR